MNFAAKHRYIVALRKLKDSAGTKIPAPGGLPLPTRPAASPTSRRSTSGASASSKSSRPCAEAGIKRRNLYLAWDFTVSSDREHRRAHALHPQRRLRAARRHASSTTPGPGRARRLPRRPRSSTSTRRPQDAGADPRGSRAPTRCPCYLQPNCEPGGRFALDGKGLPSQNGTCTAQFNCGVPHAAVDAAGAPPGRPQVYGHGLLGSASQATSSEQQTLAQTHGFVFCATTTIGFSSATSRTS